MGEPRRYMGGPSRILHSLRRDGTWENREECYTTEGNLKSLNSEERQQWFYGPQVRSRTTSDVSFGY